MEKPVVFEDSILVGLLMAFGVPVVPKFDKESRRVIFECHGDVATALSKVHNNEPIGSRDALQAVKGCRSAIFNFKGTK